MEVIVSSSSRRRRSGLSPASTAAGGCVWVGVVMQERDVVILCFFFFGFPACPELPRIYGKPFIQFNPHAERTPALALGTGVSTVFRISFSLTKPIVIQPPPPPPLGTVQNWLRSSSDFPLPILCARNTWKRAACVWARQRSGAQQGR